ncbi:hypothetical protein [Ruminococcus callidus]
MKADTQFWRNLKANRQKMTKQQYRTIKGCGLPVATSRKARSTDRGNSRDLAVSGKVLDARKGLQKVLKRRNGA